MQTAQVYKDLKMVHSQDLQQVEKYSHTREIDNNGDEPVNRTNLSENRFYFFGNRFSIFFSNFHQGNYIKLPSVR